MKKNSLQRKQLLAVIRNKGNYLQSKVTNFLRPVRKPALKRESSNPLPCNRCYGYFARKQLWRHMRRCPANKSKEQVPYSHNLAQNMLLGQVEGNDFLKKNVFPHMRADNITLAVKSDPLICAYGGRFAKTHQDKHQVNFISRKMRELGKLLISIRKADPQIKSLMDALKPEHYDLLVKCTKEVAGFHRENNRFSSPTYAMNIQTSLKDCCQIACNYLYQHAKFPDKKSYDEAEFPFKRLIATIASEWKYDISHHAANNLQSSTMNKITIVPLANDLYRFKQYLITLANVSVSALEYDDRNSEAYRNLLQSAYCRVMLLCRKRCGELSRLTVELYKKSGDRETYEEFADAIRPSEMLLVRKFKRIVIQGKRKTTPIIFSADVQNHIDLVLKLRSHFVPESNPYVFVTLNTDNHISGYQVIRKHALNADLAHPEAITTRCLRKHLATVCQVLAMSDQDIEQLATFMGHTTDIHKKEYRLPDHIFQTAKVSKLLLMMEAGQAGQFKGKTLDEIEVDMESDILGEIGTQCNDIQDDEELAENRSMEDLVNVCAMAGPSTSSNVQPTASTSQPSFVKKKKFQRDTWSDEEKRIVLEYFSEHIQQKKPPKKGECELLISQHPDVLKHRTWQKVKVFIHNAYSNKRST
uniref:Uncharacterized protein n=2 Tax=Lygus hesperus TaxID=30085 RepID=A0A0A9WNV2_LYGHE